MIPFMAGQSFAMGEAFGKGFQYGKRRISAMTNEEFNKMSALDHFEETTADISAMIPAMKTQMSKFTLLQSDIIKELIGYVRQLPADIVGGLTGGGIPSLGDDGLTIDIPPTLSDTPIPTGGTAWFLLGISALMKLWAREGNISYESLAIYEAQYAAAIFSAQKNQDERRLRAIRDEILSLAATERFEERSLDAFNKLPATSYISLVAHGYQPKIAPKLIPEATSKRRKTQSSDIELKRLGLLFWSQYNFAQQQMQIINNNPAATGKQRLNLRTVVVPHLNKVFQAWINFNFTYSI